MKVLLVLCAGGMTSGLMAQKMEKCAKEKGIKINTGFMSDYRDRNDFLEKNKNIELFLGYGGAQIRPESLKGFEDIIKGVLISPQVRFYHKDIKKVLDPLNIPCDLIDSLQFGRMQGDLVLEQGLKLIEF